ncbi:MAG: L-fucose/L-arabinose isomerase family protein, partial [Planctomycetes bacterium]|nr:L-fucose/L-arabinose isomerase family protein [Planctomycetota bacterium]
LGRRRPGFDPEWASLIVARLTEQLRTGPFVAYRPEAPIVDEASLEAAVAECQGKGVSTLVVLQPTMSDGNLAVALDRLWPGPLVLWATPEKPEGSMISSCSLVGTHVFASTLRQLRHPFELVYGMPGVPETAAQLHAAVQLAVAVQRLRHSKVGLVGSHAPGFVNMAADPVALRQRLGPQLRQFGQQEFQDLVQGVSATEIEKDLAAFRALRIPLLDMAESDLSLASRYYLAMKQLCFSERLDALAVRCWPECPSVLGQWPYIGMARLATDGYPIACEGDVDGAVCCLAGALLGFGEGYLSDWLEHNRSTITLWHGGNACLGLCEPVGAEFGPRAACHFNNRKPGVLDANLKADQAITLFRFWRCDGEYLLTAQEGRTLAPRRPLKGTNGLAELPGTDVVALFEELCHAGMPHHVAVFGGHHAAALHRLARLLNVCVVG